MAICSPNRSACVAQLLLDQHAQRRAVPIVGDQKIVGAADGNQPRAEAIEEVLDRARARRGLPRDGVDHRQHVLGAVSQLPKQETELVLIGLALADVDGDRSRAENGVMLVAQRLDQEIERALPAEQLEIGLELLRLAGFHDLLLRRHDGFGGFVGQDLGVGLAYSISPLRPGRRVVRPGEAQVLVLAEHRDRRAAQRNLEALFASASSLVRASTRSSS